MRDAQALKDAVDEGAAELGGLDAAVADSGVLTVGTWDTTTPEQWRLVVDINLIGAWNTCAAALPHLLDAGGGSLINISSSVGIKGTPLRTPYTTAKHGVVGMSSALANELAAQNVRVNTVHSTGVRTGMAPLFMNALPVLATEAIEVSNAVLFLVSDENPLRDGVAVRPQCRRNDQIAEQR